MNELESRVAALEHDAVTIKERLDRGDSQFDEIKDKLDSILNKVEHIVNLWESAKGFIQITKMIGGAAKGIATFLTSVGVICGAIYAYFKLKQ